MERKPNKCRYVEGDQSALKTFAMRIFGRIHEVKAQQIKAEERIEEERVAPEVPEKEGEAKKESVLPRYVEGEN